VNELACLIGLLLVPGVGESKLKSLVNRYGSAARVLGLDRSELTRSGILDHAGADALASLSYADLGEKELERLRGLGGTALSFKDEDYPANLKPLEEAPPVLYMLGTLRKGDSLAIAIIGSRRASAYGRAAGERLSFDLAKMGVTVVSGLANGIDTAAHKGALRAGGRTIAVLGCGLDVDYPASNRNLRQRIVSSGALVTEFPTGTQPLPGNFPKRNRIVSGLSLGVVVVEAAPNSGTFSTVKWAAEQGREVFAVPGDINRRTSSGTNRLISDGAVLTTSADGILEEIGVAVEAAKRVPLELTDKEKAIVGALEEGPTHVDEIAKRSKMAVNSVLTILLSLELKGFVRQEPGKIFSLSGTDG
jgi:DNA processing protein